MALRKKKEIAAQDLDNLFYGLDIEETAEERQEPAEKKPAKKQTRNNGAEYNLCSLEHTPLAQISNHRWLYEIKERGEVIVRGTRKYKFHAQQTLRRERLAHQRKTRRKLRRAQSEALVANQLVDIGLRAARAIQHASQRKVGIKLLGQGYAMISWQEVRKGDYYSRGSKGWRAIIINGAVGGGALDVPKMRTRRGAERVAKRRLAEKLLEEHLGPKKKKPPVYGGMSRGRPF